MEIREKIKDHRGKTSSVKHMSLYMCLIAIMWMLSLVNGVNIKGSFKFCSHNDNSPVLDFDESCNLDRSVSKVFKTGKFNLLERSLYLINGFGYACSRIKITAKTKKSFFGAEDSVRDERRESIDREECLAMVISKKCQNQKLSCNGDRCQSMLEPAIEFAWMKELTFHSYYCFVNKVEIKGHQLNLPLFANSKNSCLPKDLVCQVNDKTYIWEKNIIHNCPFTVVKEVELNVTDTFAMSKNLFFQIKTEINECNMKIFESTEGLYFTDNKDSYNLPKSNRDLNLEHHIMLSDLDKKSFNILEIMDNLVIKMQLQYCFLMTNMLDMVAKRVNEYSRVKDSFGGDIYLYNKNGELLVAKCKDVKEIWIEESNNEACLKEIPVQISNGLIKVTAYLANNMIIKAEKSKRNTCEDFIYRKINNDYSAYKGSSISLVSPLRQRLKLPFSSSKINLSFTHPEEHALDWMDDVVNRVGIELNEFDLKDQVKSEPYRKSVINSDLFARMDIIILYAIGLLILVLCMVIFIWCLVKRYFMRMIISRKYKVPKIKKVDNVQ